MPVKNPYPVPEPTVERRRRLASQAPYPYTPGTPVFCPFRKKFYADPKDWFASLDSSVNLNDPRTYLVHPCVRINPSPFTDQTVRDAILRAWGVGFKIDEDLEQAIASFLKILELKSVDSGSWAPLVDERLWAGSDKSRAVLPSTDFDQLPTQ